MDLLQHVSKHGPLLSQQTPHAHVHVQMFETRHSNIVPECQKEHQSMLFDLYERQLFNNKNFVIEHTWLKNKAKCASSTASSISASSQTINGDFPPSSKVTGLRLLLAAN